MKEPVPAPYAATGPNAPDFQRMRAVDLPFEVALEHLRQAIRDAGLWILHEIDPQALLLRDGHKILPARQILFFHPRFVVEILGIDPAALIEAPLKIAVVEAPDGRVTLRWFAPDLSFARYHLALLARLGRELAALSDAIVTQAVSGGAIP